MFVIILVVAVVSLSLLLLVRTLRVLHNIRHGTSSPLEVQGHTVKTLMVLGSGGHTGEMLQLVKALDPSLYTPRIYVTADSDNNSIDRLRLSEHGVEVSL